MYTGSIATCVPPARENGKRGIQAVGSTNDKEKTSRRDSGGLSCRQRFSRKSLYHLQRLAESPIDSNTIYVGTDDGNFRVTINGGKTWVNRAAAYNLAGIPKTKHGYPASMPSVHSMMMILVLLLLTIHTEIQYLCSGFPKTQRKTWTKLASMNSELCQQNSFR